jgi:hypothetical protein
MARLRFCGFDYNAATGGIVSGSAATGMNLDKDFLFVSYTSDTTFYAPGLATPYVAGSSGRGSASGALGAYISEASSNFNARTSITSCAVPRSAIGSPSQIWTTFDLSYSTGLNVDDPTNLMRSEARFQIFKFGDLSLRLRRIFNYVGYVADITFEAFNGSTSLGTITLTPYSNGSWIFCRIYAKLDGSTGRFDITLDGQSVSYTGLNSVATTPLASVNHLYFSGGILGYVSGTNGPLNFGLIDNLLLDDAAFPSGRPRGQRVTIASDGTLSGWESNPTGSTLTGALFSFDAGWARGTNNGSTALLNLTAPSTAGLNGVLGWQIHTYGISNVDTISTKKLRTGVDVSGAVTNGTYVASLTPPATPSTLVPTYIDTLFYSSGSTDFTLAGVPNTKLRLEVIS